MIYYVKLALLSIRQTPLMSLLMVFTLAIGIGVFMSTFGVYRAMSSNPFHYKDHTLFAVQLDSWGPKEAYQGMPNQMPDQITYQDALALLRSDLPHQRAASYIHVMSIKNPEHQRAPYRNGIRVTGRDFFSMFDVPFIYGGAWSEEEENNADQVVVIDTVTNQRLFNGENSIGETVELDGRTYRVVGVRDEWALPVRVYDLTQAAHLLPMRLYIPFSLTEPLGLDSFAKMDNWQYDPDNPDAFYSDVYAGEMVWLQYWVGFDHSSDVAADKAAYEQLITRHILEQKAQGRFQRPLKFALSQPSEWLELNQVVSRDNQTLVWLAMGFLLVCVTNSGALMMTKLQRYGQQAGIRRALGARRLAIFSQHLIESATIGVVGALLGIGFTLLGQWGIRLTYAGHYEFLARMDTSLLLLVMAITVLSAVVAGLIPAWKVGQTNPSIHLKS